MNWFRHYSGAAFHPKWRTVARRTGATIERVNFVWDSLLEHASAQADDERGSVAAWDPEVVADHLMCDAEQVRAIRRELEAVGSVAGDRVEGWDRRQFVSDSSAERVRRHRQRKRLAHPRPNGGETPPTVTDDGCNVTYAVGNGPEQNRADSESESSLAATGSRDPRARAREAAAAAIPESDQIPVEGDVLMRVVAEGRDECAAAGRLAVWKAAYPKLYGQVLTAALAEAHSNVMALASIKFEAERERLCRAQAAGEAEGAAIGNGTVISFALQARRARILNGTEDDDKPQSRRDVHEQARGGRLPAPEGAADAGRLRRLCRHLDGLAEELPPARGDAGHRPMGGDG